MSPNLESHITTRNKPTNGDIPLILTPLTEVDILFEENNHLEEHVEFIPDLIVPNDINYIPLEQNLRGLLVSSCFIHFMIYYYKNYVVYL